MDRLFLALSVLISIGLMLLVIGPIGLTMFEGPDWVDNWTVFGLNAAASGIIADQILRRGFQATIVASAKPRLPLVWLWVSIMVLVALLGAERVLGTFRALKLRPGG